jgi:hypothetical protein
MFVSVLCSFFNRLNSHVVVISSPLIHVGGNISYKKKRSLPSKYHNIRCDLKSHPRFLITEACTTTCMAGSTRLLSFYGRRAHMKLELEMLCNVSGDIFLYFFTTPIHKSLGIIFLSNSQPIPKLGVDITFHW